jgi:hypothetical protein
MSHPEQKNKYQPLGVTAVGPEVSPHLAEKSHTFLSRLPVQQDIKPEQKIGVSSFVKQNLRVSTGQHQSRQLHQKTTFFYAHKVDKDHPLQVPVVYFAPVAVREDALVFVNKGIPDGPECFVTP